MPPLPHFSNNPLLTRADLISLTTALLRPLTPYTSPSGARIRLPISTGAHFDETAAQLEGYARPLWAVAALYAAAEGDGQAPLSPEMEELLRPWRDGIAAGTDPGHEEFWGVIGDVDQRMVEVEIIAFGLLVAPGVFYHGQTGVVQGNIRSWLEGVRGKRMPETNWRWFRILANLALVEVCAVEEGEVRGDMEGDLEIVEGFYVGGGWSGDGWWRGEGEGEEPGRKGGDRGVEGWLEDAEVGRGQQMDYYSGSFAIQFSQLLYVKYAAHRDPERVERYKQQAREFVGDFWRYFDEEGAAIPFGRSLTYRFAFAGIFSTIVLADLTDLPPPFSSMGTIKGLLLRHLRWWARHSADIFHTDGTMNIGFLFPNMYMSEDYNSPQSVYWCMKTLIIVALPETHEFWTCEELPHPLAVAPESPSEDGVSLLPAPMQILANHPHAAHHFLLSSSQFCAWPLKASEAKYCKFAYSSAFGFSVPTGPLIQQMAPDNTLALSRDHGATWAVKWKTVGSGRCGVLDVSPDTASGGEVQQIPTLTATWHPWPDGTVEVETTLIPPTNRWPDWHVRVHVVRSKSPTDITTVEGGFAISGRRRDGSALPQLHLNPDADPTREHELANEGTIESGKSTNASALILSPAGVSGVVDLSHAAAVPVEMRPMVSAGRVLKPDSNTNLMCQRTLIPTVRHAWGGGPGGVRVRVIVVGVFCRDGELGRRRGRGRGLKEVGEAWKDRPVVRVDGEGGVVGLG
ncbi:hypothetical protein FQN50_004660 [Emmonsiellopsis sp. PD_5]|nr:hypothetical protein FQN50_004660 [Emmonsiellopsis sp. PD_5]